MSMFPVQNYGKDFTESFVGMGNFINGMDQRKFENERQLKADDRSDKALKLQQDSTASSIAHNNAQTAKISREDSDAKELQKWIRLTFDELGADFMFVDEAHQFRKVGFETVQQVKGIDNGVAVGALDLFLKTNYLNRTNPGRSGKSFIVRR